MNPTPFRAAFAVRSLADVQRLEQTPLDQALPVQSTYEIFCNSAAAFGPKVALTFLPTADPAGPVLSWTYAELLAGIHQTANLLHRLGVGPQDAVAVLLPACLEYHLALWGGEAAGIVQPLNPLLSDDALASMMNAARTKVLVALGAEGDAQYGSKALRLRARVPSLQALVRVDPPDGSAPAPAATEAADGVIPFAQRSAEPHDRLVSGRRISPDDVAAYFHTGGTTGAPKLARHSHRNQVYTAWASVMLQGVGPDDVTLNGYPLFHVAGVLPGSLASLSAGVEVVIPTTGLFRNREVISNYWRLVERHRATVLSAVPTVLAALANVPVDADISSLRYCRTGAAPLAPELAARFKQHTGLHVHESLGMTEMAGISTITPPGLTAAAGCVGLRLPHSQLRIAALDGDGQDDGTSTRAPRVLGPGQRGMVQFRAPNVIPGFVDARNDAHAFTADGWLASGDIGWLDEQGLLHLAGRSKDLIIRSGHNIDPRVIEDALGAHPAVQLCAAVGAPDAYAGELPVAFATLRPGASVTEAELLDFTAARVDEAPAKPKTVSIIERMPVTNVGKVYKPELRAMAAAAVVRAAAAAALQGRDVAVPEVVVEGEKVVLRMSEQLDAATEAAMREAVTRLPCEVEFRRVG